MNIKLLLIFKTIFFIFLFSCTRENQLFIYVSTEGNDENPGTVELPFHSVVKAQETVRKYKKDRDIPKKGVIVYFRKGIYSLHKTLCFTAEDNGMEGSPVIYRSFPGEEVSFTGGKVVNNFIPLCEKEVKKRIPGKYHDKIWQANLKDLGINNFGEIKSTGMGRPVQPAALELFFNGEPMILARYPNQGEWMRIASVPQTGDSLINEGGDGGSRFGIPLGRHYGRFKYNENKPGEWLKNDNIWLHGYWTWDWADSYVKVDRIEPVSKEFVLAEPHGVYGYTQNQRYYALNVLEELDSPGEWFLDNQTGILYFWPPSPINEGVAIVSVLEELMIHLDNTEYVRLENIIFESSRGQAIRISSGCNNLVAGCTIRNIGSNAISLDGGHNNGVRSCDIYNVGDGGINISGGDRKTLTAGNNFAINNHIYRYSRINKTYRPAISLQGVGNHLSNNCIHDAPHSAVIFGGNEHILEFNEVYDIAKETGDVGAFYIGRDWTSRGNIIRYNYFHHLTGPGLYGVMAVYLDDAASGATICGNVFYKSGRSAFVGGGHDNLVENNVFVECEPSIHLDARGMGWARESMSRGGNCYMYEKLEEVNYNQPPYSTKYPSLARILDWGDPLMPKGNIFRANLSYGGTWRKIDNKADEVTIENNYVLKEVPAYIDVDNGNFYPENEMILNDIGFVKIPFDKIGLFIDEYRQYLPKKGDAKEQKN